MNQGWVGSALGVIGIVSAIIMAFLFRSRSRIRAQVNSLQLLGHNHVLPKELEFVFKGTRVPNVTLSHVAIWNMGNTTLRRDQIVASDPLRIVTSAGSTVLEVTILQRTRDVNDFSCAVRLTATNEVECGFDYLDPRDGVLVRLIHTGDEKVRVVGTLRGVPKGVWVSGVPKKPEFERALLALFEKRYGHWSRGYSRWVHTTVARGSCPTCAPTRLLAFSWRYVRSAGHAASVACSARAAQPA